MYANMGRILKYMRTKIQMIEKENIIQTGIDCKFVRIKTWKA